MFGADVFVGQALGFFGGVGEDSLALVGQGKIDRGGDFFADFGVAVNLFADRFDGGIGTQKAIGQGSVFAEQAEQQVLALTCTAGRTGWLRSGRRR